MEKHLSELDDIEITICLDNTREAEGIEKRMVDEINSLSFEQLKNEFKFNRKQIELIESILPVNRFWNINSSKVIGKKTYEKLFQHFYIKHSLQKSNCQQAVREQLSLFLKYY